MPRSAQSNRHASLSDRLLRCSAAAGAGTACWFASAPASADPVAFDPPGGLPIVYDAGSVFKLPIDIDGDVFDDYVLEYRSVYGGGFELTGDESRHRVIGDFLQVAEISGYTRATRLEDGAVVNGALPSNSGGDGGFLDLVGTGSIPAYTPFRGSRGFVGLKIEDGLDDYFGYLEVGVAPGGTSLTIYGGAIETDANTPIAVPESGALASLAVGAAAVLALRARRAARS